MTSDVRERILELLSRESGVSIDEIDKNKDFRDQVNLDSMQYLSIIARIEHEFHVSLPIEVMEVSSINGFIEIVQKTVRKKKGKAGN